MSFKKTFFQNLLVSGGFNYATQGILFFSTVFTSRLLDPRTFGFVALISVFTGFVSIFSDSGVSYAVIRSDYKRTYHKALDNLALYLGILLCVVTWVCAYPIALFFRNPGLFVPTLVMGLLFIFKSMALVRGALLSKALRFNVIGKVTLLATCIQVLLTIAMAWWGSGFWSLIIPQFVSALLVIVLYERTVKLGFRIYSVAYVKVAYAYTKKIIGNLMGFNLINYWARNLDNLLVGRSFGAGALGLYNRAYNLLMMPMSIITGLVSTVLLPSLKRLKVEGGDISREYLFILKMISVVTFPVSCILILFPQGLVLLLWGTKWLEVSRFLPYFGILLFSQSLLSTTGSVLVLFEKERIMRWSGWISTVATTAGIVYGARISMLGIAQFYSLTFLAIVLPFNVFYLFIYAFRFEARAMLLFWMPLIGGSLLVWVACYIESPGLKFAGVAALCAVLLWQTGAELKRPWQKRLFRQKAQLAVLPSK